MINSFPFIILILDESPIDLLKLPYQGIKKATLFLFSYCLFQTHFFDIVDNYWKRKNLSTCGFIFRVTFHAAH